MNKKTKIESVFKTTYTFQYKKGEIPLSFNLSSKEDMVEFLELLKRAIVDVEEKLKLTK